MLCLGPKRKFPLKSCESVNIIKLLNKKNGMLITLCSRLNTSAVMNKFLQQIHYFADFVGVGELFANYAKVRINLERFGFGLTMPVL